MVYNVILTYRNYKNDTGNFIGLVYADSESKALEFAINLFPRPEEYKELVSHAVAPMPDHPHSSELAMTWAQVGSSRKVYLTLLAEKIPNSLDLILFILKNRDGTKLGEGTMEQIEGILSDGKTPLTKPEKDYQQSLIASNLLTNAAQALIPLRRDNPGIEEVFRLVALIHEKLDEYTGQS